MFNNSPKLTESGVSYFLKETLKNCKTKKYKYYSNLVNIGLALLFLTMIVSFLYFKKKKKLSKEEKQKLKIEKEKFILDKIKNIQDLKKKKEKTLITNLPKFESDFEILHKNFYKV
tara:strand:- start:854 stop:1201 length:348 start_codon:yes stop_codon:yes gene_type:complete